MTDLVVLDSVTLGDLSHPRCSPAMSEWVTRLESRGCRLGVPEIADYEVRRELLRANKLRGLRRLDALKERHAFMPITSPAMGLAAQIWAEARRRGRPGAHRRSLDADVIIIAQAVLAGGDGAQVVVATTNTRHFEAFVNAQPWQEIA